MGSMGIPELIVLAVIAIVGLFIFGRIFAKAGYSRWFGLLMFVPAVNLAVICWFAFADWPVLQKDSISISR